MILLFIVTIIDTPDHIFQVNSIYAGFITELFSIFNDLLCNSYEFSLIIHNGSYISNLIYYPMKNFMIHFSQSIDIDQYDQSKQFNLMELSQSINL